MMTVRARGGVRDCTFFFFYDTIHMKLIRKLTTLLLLFYVITFSLFSINHAVEKIILHYNYVILFYTVISTILSTLLPSIWIVIKDFFIMVEIK